MMSHLKRIAIVVACVGVAAWLFINRDHTEWSDTIPARYQGEWSLVNNNYEDEFGITMLRVHSSRLGVTTVDIDGYRQQKTYPVRRVSITTKRNPDIGRLVIFYGDPDEDHIAENRIEIIYGMKDELSVYEIVPTGYGQDRWFEVGEFARHQ